MFTGIVEQLGEIVALDLVGDSARLTVRGPRVVEGVGHGDSIAVNGCCLTVTAYDAETFVVDVMAESLDRTSLGDVTHGSRVNLERAVTADTRLGGHLVQGHVDGTGVVLERQHSEHWDVVWIALPADLARYVAMKGSISVDGVSLTVSGLRDGDGADAEPAFSVSLIPTTLERTTLGFVRPGDRLNLEVDVISKYVERLLGADNTVVERLLGADNTVVERLLGGPSKEPA